MIQKAYVEGLLKMSQDEAKKCLRQSIEKEEFSIGDIVEGSKLPLLHFFAKKDKAGLVVVALELGAELDGVGDDKAKATALHYAATYGRDEVAVALLERGANATLIRLLT